MTCRECRAMAAKAFDGLALALDAVSRLYEGVQHVEREIVEFTIAGRPFHAVPTMVDDNRLAHNGARNVRANYGSDDPDADCARCGLHGHSESPPLLLFVTTRPCNLHGVLCVGMTSEIWCDKAIERRFTSIATHGGDVGHLRATRVARVVPTVVAPERTRRNLRID